MADPYWQFFIAVESDLDVTTRYVECSADNFATYSVGFAQIILSACSEVDVVSKLLCDRVQPNNDARNINDYRSILHSSYARLHDLEILVPRYNLSFKPWQSWATGTNPDWWTLYNKIKHERHNYFKAANLENALLSVSGLFCLVLYFYHEELRANVLQPWSKLLTLNPDWNSRIRTDLRSGYILPEFRPA